MDIQLRRNNYGNIGPALSNCFKILHGNERKQQKIAASDVNGNFLIFCIENSDLILDYNTSFDREITCLELGGISGSQNDTIFLATRNIVKGYNRKGKLFLSFDTNLTECIKCMFVTGAELITCGDHVCNHYRDCKAIGTYICGDSIVDVIAMWPKNIKKMFIILACTGRVIRVLEHCRVRQTIELLDIPTVLYVKKDTSSEKFICGFIGGSLGIYNFDYSTGKFQQFSLLKPKLTLSAITCIDSYEVAGNGYNIVYGRKDGTVGIFIMPSNAEDLEARQIFCECFEESIAGIQCYSSSNGLSEILGISHSGTIFGLTSHLWNNNLKDKEIKKETLHFDVNKLSNNTEEYVESKNVSKSVDLSVSKLLPDSPSVSSINDELIFHQEIASYCIILEDAQSLKELLLESEPVIQLFKPITNSIKVSEGQSGKDGYRSSMKIDMKADTKKFELQFLTIEGQYGKIQLNILANNARNCIPLKTYHIRPLSLHIRSHSFDSRRPLNILLLKGSFTLVEMHGWLYQCIPEVPKRCSNEESSILYFRNVLLNTMLECKFSKSSAEFRSDNLSTISILKEFLTKEATKKRIGLQIKSNISEESVVHVLKIIEPIILKYLELREEYKYLQALLEIDFKDVDDLNYLMPEYRSILLRQNEIKETYQEKPLMLNRIFAVLTDFFIDRFKFNGIFVKDQVPKLLTLLEDFNYESVISYFKLNNDTSASENSEIYPSKTNKQHYSPNLVEVRLPEVESI